MKQDQTNKTISAKTILSFAVCTLLCSTTAAFAEDHGTTKAGQGTPGTGTGTSSSASTSSSTSSQLSRADQKFVKDAAKGGMMEVHMGQLGIQKAQNEQVKQYAQRLIDDHTKANAELKQLAATKGIQLPGDDHMAAASSSSSDRTKVRASADSSEASGSPGKSEHSEHGSMKKLETLSGTDFDREFVRMAVTDHEKDVKEFEKQAQKGDDADIKAFAQKTAPTLREHLQQAKTLQSQVGTK